MAKPYFDHQNKQWVGEHEETVLGEVYRTTEWFDTKSEADFYIRYGPGVCTECGEGDGEHDRCCLVGYEEWGARVDLAYSQE